MDETYLVLFQAPLQYLNGFLLIHSLIMFHCYVDTCKESAKWILEL